MIIPNGKKWIDCLIVACSIIKLYFILFRLYKSEKPDKTGSDIINLENEVLNDARYFFGHVTAWSQIRHSVNCKMKSLHVAEGDSALINHTF